MKYSECVSRVRKIILDEINDREVKFENAMEKAVFYKSLAGEIALFIYLEYGLKPDTENSNGVVYEVHEKLSEEIL